MNRLGKPKNILYFFPQRPLQSNAGSVTRAIALLNYFKNRGFQVDFVNSNDDWGEELSEDDRAELVNRGLVRTSYGLSKKPPLSDVFGYLRYALGNIIFRKILKIGTAGLADFSSFFRQRKFDAILKAEDYDYIIVSYAYWANLIRDNALVKQSKIIIDTHDWLTAQDQNKRRFNIGRGFVEEIERLDSFDEIWSISADEQYVFEQFCKKPVRFVPIGFEGKAALRDQVSQGKFKFDIIYIAGDNMHNVKACKWFFERVYDLLPKELSICVIGKINQYVPELSNVTKLPFVENLDDYYYQASIAICPMLSGTGVKIKVVEALSYGLPVVCNRRGVDGLVNKHQNGCVVADTAEDFAFQVARLLTDRSYYDKVSADGKLYFDHHHHRDAVYAKLDQAFL